MGEVPIAPYETPGGQQFADTVKPFLKGTNTIILKSHGTVTFGKDLEDAYWKTEILDAYCRILLLSRQLGHVDFFSEQKTRELLDLKKRLGFDDPRFQNEDCDLCGNSAFREGYQEATPRTDAFGPPPQYPGYLAKGRSSAPAPAPAASQNGNGQNVETLVKAITDQVMAAMA
jgi:L-fuculose-phosphate aldolase